MRISSPAFREGESIPPQYTCDGEDINPPLFFSNVPPETQSLALLVDDPDAPAGDWVHWLVWNLPPETREIKEGSGPARNLPTGSAEGMTDFKTVGWGGPCPGSGQHRYQFKLYALSVRLELAGGATKADWLAAAADKTLATAQLTGLYQRHL